MQGRILPSEYSLISLFMISFTYWCWPCLWRRWRSWNPAMVLFSSYSLMGLILSTCHHCTHTDRKKPFSYNTGGYYGFFHILFSILQKLVSVVQLTDLAKLKKLLVSPVTMLDEPEIIKSVEGIVKKLLYR